MINLSKYTSKGFRIRFLKLVLCFYLFLLSLTHIFGQQVNEYTLKSAFLFKVPVFIEWPATASYLGNQNNFVISVIGTDPFNGKLESIIKSANIKIKNKSVTVKTISKLEEIEGADILFISNSEKYNLDKILNYIKDKPILTFSESKIFIDKGVMINMYIEDNKMEFNVNIKSSGNAKIYISSKLLVNANRIIK